MADQKERDKIVAAIIALLYEAEASQWTVQDKGVLLAAIKLQLQEREE